jgi:hypothetical protein
MIKIDDHIAYVYCNGIKNTKEDAIQSAGLLGKILKAQRIHIHYNNGYFDPEFVGIETTLSAILGGLVLGPAGLAVGIGVLDFSLRTVNQRKEKTGTELAWKIAQYLVENDKNQVFLVGHSQGGNVIKKALTLLESYKDRIVVLNLGSKPIETQWASRIMNIQHKGDSIPWLMDMRDIFLMNASNGKSYSCLTDTPKEFEHDPHAFKSYMGNSFVREALYSCQKDLRRRVFRS